jgi:hypothetical protein
MVGAGMTQDGVGRRWIRFQRQAVQGGAHRRGLLLAPGAPTVASTNLRADDPRQHARQWRPVARRVVLAGITNQLAGDGPTSCGWFCT